MWLLLGRGTEGSVFLSVDQKMSGVVVIMAAELILVLGYVCGGK